MWCYTGFTYEQLAQMPHLQPVLDQVDVLVDGPFIESQRNLLLPFRGSSNQRLIDLAATRRAGCKSVEEVKLNIEL